MKLIVECSQKLVRLGENLWGKEQKLDKEMQEHQKLCDEIMAIQGIEPIEAEMEQIIHCPEGYQFKDENGNIINATKIVLEKKKKEYPKTYEECCRVLGLNSEIIDSELLFYHSLKCGEYTTIRLPEMEKFEKFIQLYLCRNAYWKLYGDEMGLGKPWEPDWKSLDPQYIILYQYGGIDKAETHGEGNYILTFPTKEMRDAFKENFDPDIEICKELL